MAPAELARIEAKARQMRAEVLAQMIRAFFHRTSKSPVAGARTA